MLGCCRAETKDRRRVRDPRDRANAGTRKEDGGRYWQTRSSGQSHAFHTTSTQAHKSLTATPTHWRGDVQETFGGQDWTHWGTDGSRSVPQRQRWSDILTSLYRNDTDDGGRTGNIWNMFFHIWEWWKTGDYGLKTNRKISINQRVKNKTNLVLQNMSTTHCDFVCLTIWDTDRDSRRSLRSHSSLQEKSRTEISWEVICCLIC